MALINCEECGGKVSDTAAACPHCGAPVSAESKAIGTGLQTVQETSKVLKVHLLCSASLFWFGVAWLLLTFGDLRPDNIAFSPWPYIVLGFIYNVYTKVLIWWFHK